MEARTNGESEHGRPWMEYEKHMEEITKRRGWGIDEMKRTASDRDKFRNWVETPGA